MCNFPFLFRAPSFSLFSVLRIHFFYVMVKKKNSSINKMKWLGWVTTFLSSSNNP